MTVIKTYEAIKFGADMLKKGVSAYDEQRKKTEFKPTNEESSFLTKLKGKFDETKYEREFRKNIAIDRKDAKNITKFLSKSIKNYDKDKKTVTLKLSEKEFEALKTANENIKDARTLNKEYNKAKNIDKMKFATNEFNNFTNIVDNSGFKEMEM